MAFQSSPFGYTGTIDNLTAYRMRGVDRIVIRKKGGVSRQRLQTDPAFKRFRQNNQEWKACVMAAKQIGDALTELRNLKDYNYTGSLTAVCKAIQLRETLHKKGKRNVLISQYPGLLEGFGLNKYHPFDTLLRHSLSCSIDRAAGSAVVELPEAVPGVNLQNPQKQSMFRFAAALGRVTDIIYDEKGKEYHPAAKLPYAWTVAYTDWYSWKKGSPAQSLSLSLQNWQEGEGISLLLGAGVQFGQPETETFVAPTKYAGAAKVVKVG